MENSLAWYTLRNVASFDSPALVVYRDRVIKNISEAVKMVGDPVRLRPHVKTNKIAEVCRLMMDAGITKFKSATIAEAEMLAMIKAKDVLLAYQPVAAKIARFIKLVKQYPGTKFSCLVDNAAHADTLSKAFAESAITGRVFIDLNVGMNRTGIAPGQGFDLYEHCQSLSNIRVIGLHGYDGHAVETDTGLRRQTSDKSFGQVAALAQKIHDNYQADMVIIAGGSPAFPLHAGRAKIECSPGTFVFWDWGYKSKYPDQPFDFAALVITRVISLIDNQTICTDLGHKSIASEMPFPRVHFLNAPGTEAVSHSEEHLVLRVPDSSLFQPGDVLYGVPVHICPTVALYEKALVCSGNQVTDEWEAIGRRRMISI